MQNEKHKCPCNMGLFYDDCCGKVHKNHSNAKTAEELMRSRYSAFVKANGRFLVESHHISTKHKVNKKDLEDWAKSVRWKGLKVIRTDRGLSNDDFGVVEFKASFKEGFVSREIHETSKFKKEGGKWFYVDAI